MSQPPTDRILKLCPTLRAIPSAWVGGESLAEVLCLLRRPKVIVDLGVDNGYSTAVWASVSDAVVYGVDKTVDRAKLYLSQLDCERIVLVESDFSLLAANWSRPIDILHLDGDHDYEAVSRDYVEWQRHVVPGGLVVFHDTQSFPDTVGRFFNELEGPKFEVQHFCGLGVLVKQ